MLHCLRNVYIRALGYTFIFSHLHIERLGIEAMTSLFHQSLDVLTLMQATALDDAVAHPVNVRHINYRLLLAAPNGALQCIHNLKQETHSCNFIMFFL